MVIQFQKMLFVLYPACVLGLVKILTNSRLVSRSFPDAVKELHIQFVHHMHQVQALPGQLNLEVPEREAR